MPLSAIAPPRKRLSVAFEDMFDRLTGGLFCKTHSDHMIRPNRRRPSVHCVIDLLQPPPQYQQRRRIPPVVGELELLQAELFRCQSQSSNGNDVERELLDADAEQLSRWIEHLEDLVYMRAATTIPARYQQECSIARIYKQVFKRNKTRQT